MLKKRIKKDLRELRLKCQSSDLGHAPNWVQYFFYEIICYLIIDKK
jgi:hypothetical protein